MQTEQLQRHVVNVINVIDKSAFLARRVCGSGHRRWSAQHSHVNKALRLSLLYNSQRGINIP